MNPNDPFGTAIRHAQAGQPVEAERICRSILEREPDHIDSLHLLGILANQAGRHDVAIELMGKAITLNDRIPECHYNIGLAYWGLGRAQDAARHYQRALALRPNYAEACNNLGNVFLSQGKLDEALALYQRAVALRPTLLESHVNTGKALLAKGQAEGAASAVMRALAIRETPEIKALFVQSVKGLQSFLAVGDAYHTFVRAISEPWGRPCDLAAVCAGILKSNLALRDCIRRATHAWPRRLRAAELWGPSGLAAAADHGLLRSLMEVTPVCDVELERFLTAARCAMLEFTAAPALSAANDGVLAFHCALARQCFINEYVFACTDEDADRAGQLRDSLVAALTSGAAISPLWSVAVAAYFPLHSIPGCELLMERSWPEEVSAVLVQQIKEPQEERALRASIPVLTGIDDDVSILVRRQYEENPYPRWMKTAPAGNPATLDVALRARFPLVSIRDVPQTQDVLIAGCGTGEHAIGAAQQFPQARVLAVDLSVASLSYAQRKARAAGLRNVEFAQADILQLGSIGRTFDLVESVGVLHHLKDPWLGWRVLLTLLRPHGVMRIGLYSRLARADINRTRAYIAEKGYGRSAEDIRRCRQDLLSFPDNSPLKRATQSLDFFDTSSCRDLLFHVHEHQLTLPEIKAFLVGNDLQFLGFDVDPGVLQQYRLRCPDDETMTDLDRWHAFEIENPGTFLGMYQFFVQKSGAY